MSVAKRIKELPLWPSPPSLRRVTTGRTNENYVVECADRAFFARLGIDLPEHGIWRRQEARAAAFASDLGIAPKLRFAEDGLLITDYVEGRALTPGMLLDSARLEHVAKLLRQLHQASIPQGLAPFDPVAVCRGYLGLLSGPALDASERNVIGKLLDEAPQLLPIALIHADPVPENFIEDREGRIWLVDWEYAGIGDPTTDLAMLAVNCDLEESAIEALAKAHGLCSCTAVLRSRPVVAAREALWCLVQLQVRGAEGDLADYANRCLARLGMGRP